MEMVEHKTYTRGGNQGGNEMVRLLCWGGLMRPSLHTGDAQSSHLGYPARWSFSASASRIKWLNSVYGCFLVAHLTGRPPAPPAPPSRCQQQLLLLISIYEYQHEGVMFSLGISSCIHDGNVRKYTSWSSLHVWLPPDTVHNQRWQLQLLCDCSCLINRFTLHQGSVSDH